MARDTKPSSFADSGRGAAPAPELSLEAPAQPVSATAPDARDLDEAKLAADVAAEHAAHAAEQAASAERDLAEASKDDPKARLCPHCNGEMVKHGDGNPAKAGAWHCDGCGCCFKGRTVREGHPPCVLA